MCFFPFLPVTSKQINQLGPSALFSVFNFSLLPVSPFLPLYSLSLLCYFLNKFTSHFMVVASCKVWILTLLQKKHGFYNKKHITVYVKFGNHFVLIAFLRTSDCLGFLYKLHSNMIWSFKSHNLNLNVLYLSFLYFEI